jgi:hypothetical protein
VLAPPASAVRLAMIRAVLNSGLGAVHCLAPPATSMRNAVRRAGGVGELFWGGEAKRSVCSARAAAAVVIVVVVWFVGSLLRLPGPFSASFQCYSLTSRGEG